MLHSHRFHLRLKIRHTVENIIEQVRRREEESESVFISMTDLTISFLLIILVLLAFFATAFKPEETVSLTDYEILDEELSKAVDEIKHLKEMLTITGWRVTDLENRRQALVNAISELKQDYLTITSHHFEVDKEIRVLNTKIDWLSKQLGLATTVEDELSVRVEQLEREVVESGISGDEMWNRIKSMIVEVDQINLTMTNLQHELDRLRDKVTNLKKPDLLAEYLQNISTARTTLLESLAKQIRQQIPGILVTVVAVDGVIRFRGDDLFKSGQWRVQPGSTAERVARAVGDALADTLPCYTVGKRASFNENCNGAFVSIETIQIEGHTDNVKIGENLRIRENMLDNRDLSGRRGAATLRAMVDDYRPELKEFLNLHGQPILSFAGYGDMRPIAVGDDDTARATNRRIDIRFILHTPQVLPEVEEIREHLTKNRPNFPTIVQNVAP